MGFAEELERGMIGNDRILRKPTRYQVRIDEKTIGSLTLRNASIEPATNIDESPGCYVLLKNGAGGLWTPVTTFLVFGSELVESEDWILGKKAFRGHSFRSAP
jgi:hypothetical protein